MPWTWVRPVASLDGRPLLDLGCGDGQTLAALSSGGLVVGADRSLAALRAARRSASAVYVAADASQLPFVHATFRTVVAGDLFHHIACPDDVLREIVRISAPDALLVAWWYATAGRGGPGSPAFPRPYDEMAQLATRAGWRTVRPLTLKQVLPGGPPTVGLEATLG